MKREILRTARIEDLESIFEFIRKALHGEGYSAIGLDVLKNGVYAVFTIEARKNEQRSETL